MRHFVLGTAGHIDHGKSALVKALTGTDPDRLKEEKSRGITIELGFAFWETEELSVHMVDVPGHERFIRAMAAGATGIDAVMLVVAADEGVMPQTREHLEICKLLGVHAGFVAVTKKDLVEPDWLELVVEDVRSFVSSSFLEGAPVVVCSAVTGEGLEQVRAVIRNLAAQVGQRAADGIPRLPVDRVFTMKGFGTVVTGTLISGTLSLGQEVSVLPSGTRTTVRGLQVHGRDQERVEPGSRTAVNLKGVEKAQVERGEVVTAPDWIEPVTVLDAMVRWLSWNKRPLSRRKPAILMVGTTQTEVTLLPLETGQLEPDGLGPVQIRSKKPVVVLPGDRFILQGFELNPQHGSTVGGGVVLRTWPRLRRKPDPEYAAWLRRLDQAGPEERTAMELEAAGPAGLSVRRASVRLPEAPPRVASLLEDLVREGRAVRLGQGFFVARSQVDRLKGSVLEALEKLSGERPLATGFDKQEIRPRVPKRTAPEVLDLALAELVQEGKVVEDRDKYATQDQARKSRLAELARKVAALMEKAGLAPPRPREAAEALGLSSQEVESAIQALVRDGVLVSTRDNLYFHRKHVDRLRDQLVSFLKEHGQIAPLEFKDMCGVTRKYVIPLAEYFDREKLTIRVGDVRKLRGG